MARITYHHERTVEESDLSLSLLEISLKNEIPHTHACGGNARCSTCRVLIVDNFENVLPRNPAEEALAHRKGLEHDIRLACQARVAGDVTLRRLVRDEEDQQLVSVGSGMTTGREARVAVLFSDLRNFTTFSEANLPYDVIHILNRYFQPIGDAILENGGYIDKYMGDGIMALFGIECTDAGENCAGAVRAALQMRAALAKVNEYLLTFFGTELKMGVGIHYGTAVIGEIGHAKKMQFTAIGDMVNTASRVESATKEFSAGVLITECVLANVADSVEVGRQFEAALKGKTGTHTLYEVLGLH